MPADGEGVAPAFEEGVDTVAWRTLAWCAVAAAQGVSVAPVVALEGFTALPVAWYGPQASSPGVRIAVTPYASLGNGGLPSPSWLVVRGAPGRVHPPMPGPIGGVAFDTVRVAADSTPSQLIVAYRLVAR